ncbi:uncharacterized protein LOC120081101 [Benincasa hispida]|uniref:uncharacterized protein LOC120081101 n=1 Tax=Benincasa hispida TaxID=102211 RepID=UPI0018FFB0C5|nr:uncharacterized protein LOC120081101 [Benincasa hispida]
MTSATLNLVSANKLNDDNYTSWKNTINTMLIINDPRFILVEECPQLLVVGVSQNVQNAYERWVKAIKKAPVYILASLSEVLAKKHKIMVAARQIMDSLKEMFGQPPIQL